MRPGFKFRLLQVEGRSPPVDSGFAQYTVGKLVELSFQRCIGQILIHHIGGGGERRPRAPVGVVVRGQDTLRRRGRRLPYSLNGAPSGRMLSHTEKVATRAS